MIDPRAIVDPSARIAEGVQIGPYTIIGADVDVGKGTWIGPHVIIQGPTRIGADNKIFQFCSIGGDPQDKKYGGEPWTTLEIGDRNLIREYCTLNRGTVQGGGQTKVGNDNWIMAYVHIAHDCHVGNHAVFANNATLAGHVIVEDYAILGGFTGVHQFCRIGAHSFSAITSVVVKDLPPFMMVSGNTAKARGLNREGLRRNGFSTETINNLRRAYQVLYRQKLTLAKALGELQDLSEACPEVDQLVQFVRQSKRGIVR